MFLTGVRAGFEPLGKRGIAPGVTLRELDISKRIFSALSFVVVNPGYLAEHDSSARRSRFEVTFAEWLKSGANTRHLDATCKARRDFRLTDLERPASAFRKTIGFLPGSRRCRRFSGVPIECARRFQR